MAVPFSIGDLLLLINGTLSLYNRLKEAPAELMTAKRDVEQMRIALHVIKTKLSDKSAFLATQPNM